MTVLDEAAKLTSEDRQKIYGHPYDDFNKVAKMTEPIVKSDIDPALKHALYMMCVKIARLLNTPEHRDSIVDIAGYANTYAMVLEGMKEPKVVDDVIPRCGEIDCRICRERSHESSKTLKDEPLF